MSLEAKEAGMATQRETGRLGVMPPEGVVTVCGGCDAECAFLARMDERGRIAAEMPVSGHPCEAQRLCGRGKRRLQLPFLESERVTHPLRRRLDGTFEQIGWDEAYAQIAERLIAIRDAYGPEVLACTTGMSSYHAWYVRRLMAALGSPNVYGALGACESSRLAGWIHTLGYSPQSDLAHTDFIVYLGRSLVDSSSAGTASMLMAARERGAQIVTVDPRRNSTVDEASEWLKIRPGYDLALLLGIAHVLIEEDLYDHDFVAVHTIGFDEFARAMRPYTAAWAARMCDVSEDAVLRVARGLGRARPHSVIDCGFHGGLGVAYVNSVQTARMIALVDALLGDVDGQPGGNLNPPRGIELGELNPVRFPKPLLSDMPVSMAPGRLSACKRPHRPVYHHRRVDRARRDSRTAESSTSSNPAMGYGNAGDWMRMLGDLDLLVTIDIRMSETARLSDFLVLPDVTFLECDRGVGHAGSGLHHPQPRDRSRPL